MQKINFQDLPSTTTPINASNLNQVQTNVENCIDGNEPMGNIVVKGISTKNKLNENSPDGIANGLTWAGNDSRHTYTANDTFNGGVHWFFQVKANEKYTFSYKQRNSNNVFVYIAERSSRKWDNNNVLKQIVNDGTATQYSFTIENDGYLSIAFQNNAVVSNVVIENIQLELGETKTEYVTNIDFNNSFEQYSKSEIVVGKWINGKPLYQITYSIIFANPNEYKDEDTIDISALNKSQVVDIIGTCYYNTFTWKIPQVYSYDSTSVAEYVGCYISGNTLYIRRRGIRLQTGYITLKYTKSTD